jgi:hypothetical protein
MDAFGIGESIQEILRDYFGQERRTGRTTAMLEALRDGDMVVFLTHEEMRRVVRLAQIKGVKITGIVVPTWNPHSVRDHPAPEGRTVFDHSWIEAYYAQEIKSARGLIDRLQSSNGIGQAHTKTRPQLEVRHKHFRLLVERDQ